MSSLGGRLARLRRPTAAPVEAGHQTDAPGSAADRIRTAISRGLRALELRPGVGLGTVKTRARLDQGLRCVVTDGRWTLDVDMPPKMGGEGTAPTPGVLARGALASCLVEGYAMWAARLGVELEGIDVEMETDFDSRGELGLGGARPGYLEIRYRIELRPAAGVSEAEVDRVVALADAHSVIRDVFAREVPLRRVDRLEGGTA